MSDTSQGAGWWLASDGKWYPPELWTGPPTTMPPASAPPTAMSGGATAAPGQAPTYPPTPNPSYPSYPSSPSQTPSAMPPGAGPYPPSGYGSLPGGYGQYPPYAATKRTNGLAIASLVCACGGFLLFVPAILAIIFGFVARAQIRQSAGGQGGDGLALAGIIVGFAWIALFVIVIIVDATNTSSSGSGVVLGVPGLLG